MSANESISKLIKLKEEMDVCIEDIKNCEFYTLLCNAKYGMYAMALTDDIGNIVIKQGGVGSETPKELRLIFNKEEAVRVKEILDKRMTKNYRCALKAIPADDIIKAIRNNTLEKIIITYDMSNKITRENPVVCYRID